MTQIDQIPYFSFDETNKWIGARIKDAFNDFFDSKWYILGDFLKKFEAEYARYNRTQYCIGVGNGLDALTICLKALKIGPGDEVIVPSNTFIATWLAVSSVGAVIVPVEPDPFTCNIDPDGIKAAITARTKAIIPVHLYGQACKMDEIMEIAGQANLYVVEDNAQAHGAKFRGKPTGSFGNINATSFYPTKNFGALGDGGAITTDSEELALRARLLRNYGSEVKYQHEIAGMNSRLDELQAAFLSVKLLYLSAFTVERKNLAFGYDTKLGNIEGLHIPAKAAGAGHVYHVYAIRTENRDALQKHLADNGIGTMVHYPSPPHLQPAYHDLAFKKGDFPVAEELAATSLSLPLYPGMPAGTLTRVTNVIRSFYE